MRQHFPKQQAACSSHAGVTDEKHEHGSEANETGTQAPVHIQARFWSKIDRSAQSPGGCWIWNRAKNGDGYGVLGFGPRGRVRYMLAHRFAYEIAIGSIPEGMLLRHRCDTPACVNPAHLLPGTQGDNMQDSIRRGTFMRGRIHGPKKPRKRYPRHPTVKVAKALRPIAATFTDEPPVWRLILAARAKARAASRR